MGKHLDCTCKGRVSSTYNPCDEVGGTEYLRRQAQSQKGLAALSYLCGTWQVPSLRCLCGSWCYSSFDHRMIRALAKTLALPRGPNCPVASGALANEQNQMNVQGTRERNGHERRMRHSQRIVSKFYLLRERGIVFRVRSVLASLAAL